MIILRIKSWVISGSFGVGWELGCLLLGRAWVGDLGWDAFPGVGSVSLSVFPCSGDTTSKGVFIPSSGVYACISGVGMSVMAG